LNRERWVRIDAILDLALDADPSQREAVLAAECGDDQELAADVRKFLASVDDGSELFESTPHEMMGEALAAARTSSGSSLQPGDILGHYRLIEKIGSGGMGAVYHAERADGEFEKRVALKVIKRGLDTDEVVERFQTERRILARLQHPHIAALLDGGATPAGLPYFVMEYAPGEPIDRYVRRSGASLEERIRLFLIVCEAVQYAHQNLIVHRDLKPSNILVDQGNPKLLDFGIAKVLDPETGAGELATQITERRLTPQYAAPEQVVGQPVSTATDVYSLGVILYELVTEHAPYEIRSRALVELERVVCNTNPRPPSAVARETRTATEKGGPGVTWIIPPDLDAIILCALKKEPERRYGSVAAFSHDLQRFLEGRTVTARPDTALYRISKFVRRNAAMVGVGTAAVLAISIGAVVAGWQARVAGLERDRREQEARTAAASRDFLLNMIRGLDSDRLGGQVITQALLIELGLENLRTISNEPEVLAPVMNTLGQVIFNLGDRPRADSLFRAAYALLQPLTPHPDLAVSLMGMGLVHLRELRADEAIDAYRQALAMRLEVYDPADPAVAESKARLAFALYIKGESGAVAGSDSLLAESEALYQSALATLTEPTALRATALEGLADLELARGQQPHTAEDSASVQERLASAEEHYNDAIRTGALAENDTTPDGARRLWGLSLVLDGRGNEGAAVDASRRALAVMERTYGESHPDVALGHYYLGVHLQSAGYSAAAAASFERSAEVSAVLVQAMDSARAAGDSVTTDPQGQRLYAGDAFLSAGQALLAAGQPAEGLANLERSLPFYEANARAPGPMGVMAAARIADAQRQRGRALTQLGEPGSAVTPFRAALSTWNAELSRPQTSATRARTVRQSAAEVSLLLADVFDLLQQPDSAAQYRARAAQLGGY
jgi:serine/threonine protein kinase/tetratricopeptide (TPR) repeat protein